MGWLPIIAATLWVLWDVVATLWQPVLTPCWQLAAGAVGLLLVLITCVAEWFDRRASEREAKKRHDELLVQFEEQKEYAAGDLATRGDGKAWTRAELLKIGRAILSSGESTAAMEGELRRLLGLVLLQLYEIQNGLKGGPEHLSDAKGYASDALAELKRQKLEVRYSELRRELESFLSAANTVQRFAARPAKTAQESQEAGLAAAKTILARPSLQRFLEAFLLSDLTAARELIELLRIDTGALTSEAIDILVGLDDESELHLVDPEDPSFVLTRLMPAGRQLGERVPMRWSGFSGPSPHPYWDAGGRLKLDGFMTGSFNGPHKLTALGRALRASLIVAVLEEERNANGGKTGAKD